jgi:hypothetical protein
MTVNMLIYPCALFLNLVRRNLRSIIITVKKSLNSQLLTSEGRLLYARFSQNIHEYVLVMKQLHYGRKIKTNGMQQMHFEVLSFKLNSEFYTSSLNCLHT